MSQVRAEAGREIELKFLCAPEHGELAMALAPHGPEEPRELISVYFDTPEGDLRKAGASLRVRESNGRRVQTVKRGDGLSREEYELALVSGTPNLAAPPLLELLSEAQRQALRPTFGVGIRRRERLVRYGGAEIEIALDRGKLQGGGRTAAISELELELKSGAAEALFDLARELVRDAPLYLSLAGKSAQGDAMVRGAWSGKATSPTLKSDISTSEAFQSIAREALGQIAAHAATLRQGPSVVSVHQLRVAVRRLRSAMSVFKPMVEDACYERMKGELSWLGQAADPARNLDVFLAETVRPALEQDPVTLGRLAAALEVIRGEVHGQLAESLASPRFRSLLLELLSWIETGPWLEDDSARAWRLRRRPARAFAAEALQKRWRRLKKDGRRLPRLDDRRRHQVRIDAKKLRYAVEGFASLFPEKPVVRFVDRMKALQDQLGVLNDIATAQPAVGDLPLEPKLAFVAGRLAGRREAGKRKAIRRADKAMKRLIKADRFWRI